MAKGLQHCGQRKTARVNLGLAICGALTQPGERRIHREIAAFCECHWNAIWLIEAKALKKLRKILMRDSNRELREAFKELLGVKF